MNALSTKLREVFEKNQERIAIRVANVSITYRELLERADSYATRLSLENAEGGPVALMAQRTVGAYCGVLAAIFAGKPYVPINPKMPYLRQKAIAVAAGCKSFLYDNNSRDAAFALSSELGGSCIDVEDTQEARPFVAKNSGKHAYIMFTSGTTGIPKGVAVRYDNVCAYLKAFEKISPVYASDRCSQFFDLSFDLSVHDIFVTWTSGACLCVPTSDELLDPIGFAARNHISCWFSVPSVVSMARRMRQLNENALPDLRLSLFCGEPLPTSLAVVWSEVAPNSSIWNLYGPTEATIAITSHRFEKSLAQTMPASVPLGDAFLGSETVVVGNDNRPVGMGEEGELLLSGAQISDGYINNPEEQISKFVDISFDNFEHTNWYRSGDLVRLDPRWGHVFVSRLDNQIKVSGYRVEILEVEEHLRWAAGTLEVAAVPWPLNDLGAADGMVGFVCKAEFDPRTIINRLRTRVPPYMVPKRIISVDTLPLNANGKVDRKALAQSLSE